MMAWKDGADERLHKAIAVELEESAPFVTGWVLAVQYSDDAGDVCAAFNCMVDQRRSTSLGLLSHALAVEHAAVFWDARPDE